MSKYSSWVRKK